MEKVSDSTTERRYFTQVCNLIDDLDLSPLALSLYLHYKRWSAAKGRKTPGVKFLMQKFKVDSRAIKNAKAELVKNRLISVRVFDPKLAKADEIQILDIWDRNYKHFQQDKPLPVVNEQQVGYPLLDNNRPVVNEQHPPLLDNNARERNKEERKEKEGTHTQTASDLFSERFPNSALSIFQIEQIQDRITDTPKWERTLDAWKLNNYSVRNLIAMFDAYEKDAFAPKPGQPAPVGMINKSTLGVDYEALEREARKVGYRKNA